MLPPSYTSFFNTVFLFVYLVFLQADRCAGFQPVGTEVQLALGLSGRALPALHPCPCTSQKRRVSPALPPKTGEDDSSTQPSQCRPAAQDHTYTPFPRLVQ